MKYLVNTFDRSLFFTHHADDIIHKVRKATGLVRNKAATNFP